MDKRKLHEVSTFAPAGAADFRVFAPPSGKARLASGQAEALEKISIIRVTGHTFEFRRNGGDFEEKTVALDVPGGAGFVVMVNNLQFACVRGGTLTLTERPPGQFLARAGMRGNNIVCGVRS